MTIIRDRAEPERMQSLPRLRKLNISLIRLSVNQEERNASVTSRASSQLLL